MKTIVVMVLLLVPQLSLATEKADLVVVIKSESTLYLKHNGRTLNKFHVALGKNPIRFSKKLQFIQVVTGSVTIL